MQRILGLWCQGHAGTPLRGCRRRCGSAVDVEIRHTMVWLWRCQGELRAAPLPNNGLPSCVPKGCATLRDLTERTVLCCWLGVCYNSGTYPAPCCTVEVQLQGNEVAMRTLGQWNWSTAWEMAANSPPLLSVPTMSGCKWFSESSTICGRRWLLSVYLSRVPFISS